MQIDNPFRFAGEYNDDETGLIYLRNRYYDSNTGRFISEDPAMDGNNWYIYCNNNPINFVDPWGLFIITNGKSHMNYKLGSGNSNNVVDDYYSTDIMKMQKKLQELGYLDKNITWYGYFGEATLDAVNRFKADKKLKNDTADTYGIVGPTTWAYLGLDFDVFEYTGCTLSNVLMRKGVLLVDKNIANANIETTYYTAKALKSAYKLVFGEEFDVTTESVYLELVWHIFANDIAENIWRKHLRKA